MYEKKNDTSSYTLIGKINETSFETTNYTSSFKVVSLFNEKENNDYFLEIKPYFDGVFDNENVKVFSPNNNHNEINNYIDSNYKKLRSDEWSNRRIEMLFIPGNYDDVTLSLGYYMSARGLGKSPDDVNFKNLIVRDHPQTGRLILG